MRYGDFTENSHHGNDYKSRFWTILFVIITSYPKEKTLSNWQTAELSIFVKLQWKLRTGYGILLIRMSFAFHIISFRKYTVTIVMEERNIYV